MDVCSDVPTWQAVLLYCTMASASYEYMLADSMLLCVGNAVFAQQALPWLPYRLLYAVHLAEHGHINTASSYAAHLVHTLSGLQRPPPNLMVARSLASDLSQRLHMHASVRSPFIC